MNHIIHPYLFSVDFPLIEQELADLIAFKEFALCLDKAIKEIERYPANEGSPLRRPPLQKYRKKKFHSILKPPVSLRADMRLIFRYDSTNDELLLLGIGRRKPRQSDDVYKLMSKRPQI